MKEGFHALILAAGKGTRFKSNKIKILHSLLGKSMIRIVVDSVSLLDPEKVHLVVGCQKELVMQEPFNHKVNFVIQDEQLGTAHAVLAAEMALWDHMDKDLLVMNGDLPLISAESLKSFLYQHQSQDNDLTFLTAVMDNPTGFGRIIYTENQQVKIIEEKDATPLQRDIKEANVGIYIFKIRELFKALPKISNDNKKREYYITDIIEIFSDEGKKVGLYRYDSSQDIVGVNDRMELAKAANILRQRKIQSLSESGVTFYDPESCWIDLDVKIGQDTVVYPFVVIEGDSEIGSNSTLYPSVHIVDSHIGSRVKILSSTMIDGSKVASDSQVGPFTHLRPKTIIRPGAKVGNFVEMKNTVFGKNSKAGHLSYLGDSMIGEGVNIGAGTITCNFDGFQKHKTIIREGAFIGSGSQLIAPVTVGKNAYVGAGSTITKDVSPEALAISRAKQIEKKDWKKKKKIE